MATAMGYYQFRGDPNGSNTIDYLVEGRLISSIVCYGSRVLQEVRHDPAARAAYKDEPDANQGGAS